MHQSSPSWLARPCSAAMGSRKRRLDTKGPGMTVEASGDLNIDKRMEQVVGKGLRVTPVEVDQLTDEARQMAIQIRAAFGIPEDGAMPLSLRTMLIHPELFRAQMAMGIALAAGA